jgi:VWFA-related protein
MGALARIGLGLAVASAALAAPPSEPPPVASGAGTAIEVRLVTIDVVALDRDDRTVGDLTKDDLQLFVDGKETPVDTLDVFCDGGASEDPNSKRVGGWATPADLGSGTRRVVLAFDYLHLPSTPCPGYRAPCHYDAQTLQQFQDVLTAKTDVGDEEMMVVAITNGLRIEQPFTRDRRAVVESLRRMEHDVTLWSGNFDHLTEFPLFSGLNALVTVLRSVPGPKAVVVLSAGTGPGEAYEQDFRRLAARASDAEVVIYTVDSRGLYWDRGETFT